MMRMCIHHEIDFESDCQKIKIFDSFVAQKFSKTFAMKISNCRPPFPETCTYFIIQSITKILPS